MPGGIPGGLKRDNGKGRTGLECEVLAYNQLIASYICSCLLIFSHLIFACIFSCCIFSFMILMSLQNICGLQWLAACLDLRAHLFPQTREFPMESFVYPPQPTNR
jgi:hypothetical protein